MKHFRWLNIAFFQLLRDLIFRISLNPGKVAGKSLVSYRCELNVTRTRGGYKPKRLRPFPFAQALQKISNLKSSRYMLARPAEKNQHFITSIQGDGKSFANATGSINHQDLCSSVGKRLAQVFHPIPD